jgi:hypothetical protein
MANLLIFKLTAGGLNLSQIYLQTLTRYIQNLATGAVLDWQKMNQFFSLGTA